MIVPDEVVIEALLKDAKRFKSKWELHTGEPTRSKPNIKFLKRTLSNVVKTNQDRMRKPKDLENSERDFCSSSSHNNRSESISEGIESCKAEKRSRSRHDSRSRHHSKRSKNCSKSKYRSPESRNRSSKKSSTEKRSSSSSNKRRKK